MWKFPLATAQVDMLQQAVHCFVVKVGTLVPEKCLAGHRNVTCYKWCMGRCCTLTLLPNFYSMLFPWLDLSGRATVPSLIQDHQASAFMNLVRMSANCSPAGRQCNGGLQGLSSVTGSPLDRLYCFSHWSRPSRANTWRSAARSITRRLSAEAFGVPSRWMWS